MEKFKKFIEKNFKIEAFRDPNFLNTLSIKCEYLPEQIDEFDEAIFLLDDISICVAVHGRKVKRIMFVKINKDNPDEYIGLTKEELNNLINTYESKLLKFFESITD